MEDDTTKSSVPVSSVGSVKPIKSRFFRMPEAPSRYVTVEKDGIVRTKAVPTEFHRALTGDPSAVTQISNGELARQYFQEVGYMASKSVCHLERAIRSFSDALNNLLN